MNKVFTAGFSSGLLKTAKTRFDEELEGYRGHLRGTAQRTPPKPWENLRLHALLGAVPGGVVGGMAAPKGLLAKLLGVGAGVVVGGAAWAGMGELADRGTKGSIERARIEVKDPKFMANTRRDLLESVMEEREELEEERDELEDERDELRDDLKELRERLDALSGGRKVASEKVPFETLRNAKTLGSMVRSMPILSQIKMRQSLMQQLAGQVTSTPEGLRYALNAIGRGAKR